MKKGMVGCFASCAFAVFSVVQKPRGNGRRADGYRDLGAGDSADRREAGQKEGA